MDHLAQTMATFEAQVKKEVKVRLGEGKEARGINSSIGPFYTFDVKVRYPRPILMALADLYREYNKAFIPLIEAANEWKTDYKFCSMIMGSKTPVNCAVQIDMTGLPESFLREAERMGSERIREILRRRIYEIENSLAMYQLLERLFSREGKDSFFKINFRAALNKLSRKFNKPIALLAVTEEKYQAMKASEFGKEKDEKIKDEEVKNMSGFDRFFGPREFQDYLVSNDGKCEYLLYVRTSDPVAKLKNPSIEVEHPLLSDPNTRRIIRAHSLTMNIDVPGGDSSTIINDTKGYQPRMGMAFYVNALSEILSPDFAEHLFSGKDYLRYKGVRLSREFSTFLKNQGCSPKEIEDGKIGLRCKPKQAYGCYGHVSGYLNNGKFRAELKRLIKKKPGGYVIQPEMTTPIVTNEATNIKYAYIDRVFFSFVSGKPQFMGGFRSYMPIESNECQQGRNHGSCYTVWGEIVA